MMIILKYIEISLIITAIHVSFREGMLFGWLADRLNFFFDRLKIGWMAKPLYDCLPCMGGIWSLVLMPFDMWLPGLFVVIGINAIVERIIQEKC
jgi:hypothetical protein